MRHHEYIPGFEFVRRPTPFDRNTDRGVLQYCLGGTLYMPGTKNVLDRILEQALPGLTSMVMCLEDAIAETDLSEAERNILDHLDSLADAVDSARIAIGSIPLIFVRVRTPEQFDRLLDRMTPKHASILSGFVFPKFSSRNLAEYFEALASANDGFGERLFGMPILEGPEIALIETRQDELAAMRAGLRPYREMVLNIRVGATDFSSLFGVRRGINYSIYDIATVQDCLADILNCFLRDGEDYTISAPVWEYFLADKHENLKALIASDIHRSILRGGGTIVNDAIDGLLREVVLDKANGFVGKTIIHPSHLKYVNAMQAITREEYEDALQVLGNPGGVVKSAQLNKMNEISPHRHWARRTVARAEAYGVVENEESYLRLMSGAN